MPLLDNASILDHGDLDNLFIINGSTLYCKYLPEIAQAVSTAQNVIWVQNDYTLPPPAAVSDAQSPFRLAFAKRKLVPHYWTTVLRNSAKTTLSRHINWNVLGFEPTAPRALLAHAAVLYYGAWRPHREAQVRALCGLAHTLGCAVAVSSTSKQFSTVPGALLRPPFRTEFYKEIGEYGLGLYMQDKRAATEDLCPATRFYEMLSVGLPMAFSPQCVNAMKWHGYDVREYVLTKPSDLERLITIRHDVAAEQSLWVGDFHSTLEANVKEAYDALNR
jgi:hypothetical protein